MSIKSRALIHTVLLQIFVLSTLGLTDLTASAAPGTAPNVSADVEYGLAAGYPYDEGIKNHAAVIHATGFETPDWYATDFDYTGYTNPFDHGYQIADSDLAFSGNGALEYQNYEGEHYPYAFKMHDFEAEGVIFLRWYRRFQPDYDFSCQSKSNGVYARAPGEPDNDAGVRPNGYDKYSCKLQFWPGGEPKFYTYHPEQSGGYGQTLPQNVGEKEYVEPGRWTCFEIMLKPNDAGQRNGEIKLWIDGVLKAHYPGMRFRDTNDLKINELDITAYIGGHCVASKDQKVWDDGLVLAAEYIGPMVTEMPAPNPDEIIIDDTDAGFSTSYSQDPWQEYTQVGAQHYGHSHHYNEQISTGQDTATWSFTVPKPGNYDVYAWWWEADWRPSDVPYTIHHSDGSTTVRVDQRANGGQWNLLGTLYFQDEGSVIVSDDVSSGRDIVADAIRLVYRSEGPLPTNTPTPTPTDTPLPTYTPTPTSTSLPTSTPTPTSTLTPTPTNTPPPTYTPSPTSTSLPTSTPTPTSTLTPTPTNTPPPTYTPTPTSTSLPTSTPTPTSTLTPTPTNTPIPTYTPTSSPATPTVTSTLSPMNTSTPAPDATARSTSTAQPQIDQFQVFLPFVSKSSLSNPDDGDRPDVPPHRP